MWRAHDGMGWWMVFGGLLWLAFWVSIIYLIASAVAGSRSRGEHRADAEAREAPLEIAQRRYASGEITRDEYLQLCRDLGAFDGDNAQSSQAGST